MNNKWVGIVLLGVMVSTLSLAARTVTPSYLNGNVVGFDGYPQWNLGAPGSTWQDWTFNTTSDMIKYPDQYYNIYNQGNTSKYGPFAIVNDLYDIDDNYVGLGFSIQVTNAISTEKAIWFEVIYQGTVTPYYDDSYEGVEVYTGYDGFGNPTSDGVTLSYDPEIQNIATGWKVMTIGWTVKPSPSAEWFTFNLLWGDAQIQFVSIDTLSHVVPAPGAVVLAVFGVGIVGYFRRKY
ncbi:MAG: hypothetical protein JXB18_05175 [Sedimentisphaerales bacterium]|nr:hypothetical protein [Sedimentisphaerales bacterium]